MSDGNSVRAFVAIHIPASLRTELGRAVDQLSALVPAKSVRWVRKESIHLTLRFLGNVNSGDIELLKAALGDAVRRTKPFELAPGQPGCFPGPRSPRVLWVGIEGALETLTALQVKIQAATENWGKIDDHPFHPHLTLGRVNTARRSELGVVGAALGGVKIQRSEPWTVDVVHLMQSTLVPGGSEYTGLARIPLAS